MKPAAPVNADPPLWVAWHQALASIRVRFLRHAITATGIMLGTAFFSSMLTLRAAEQEIQKGDPGAQSRSLWLAGTSLVMCLVGVTNSMLMSVTERYREIGTIKCLGASDGFIVKVFVIEAALLGAIGAIAGAIFGALIMSVAVAIGGLRAEVSQLVEAAGVASLVGIVLTMIAAIAPAIQAARMPAASALRVEV
jgi:hypothetical protein